MLAAEIQKSIGDVEGLLLPSENIYNTLIDLGELNAVEKEVCEFLQSCTVPENRVHKFLHEIRPSLLFYRGDWVQALNAQEEILNELQKGDSLQRIADTKMQIAFYMLELNRFGYNDDLSEAESILLENIEDNLSPVFSNSGLVFVYIQQGRLRDAHNHFTQSKKLLTQSKITIFGKVFSPWIEYEFAIAEGRWGEAITASESLFENYQRGGYRYRSTRQLINLGDALVGRNEPGDLDRARETYQQSLNMFTEMGAPGYVKVLEERLLDTGD
jgi:tetratricopeptide (TPR) repeat protein